MKTVLMAMETELLSSGRPTTPPGREILGTGALDLEVAVGPVPPAAGKRAAGAMRPPTQLKGPGRIAPAEPTTHLGPTRWPQANEPQRPGGPVNMHG